MKVEEAKTKVCPFIQHGVIVAEYSVSFSYVDQFTHANINCLTSNCMAWICDENGLHTTNENGTIFHEGRCARIGQ